MSVYRSIVAKLDALRGIQKDMYTAAQRAEYRDELQSWADKLQVVLDSPVEEGPEQAYTWPEQAAGGLAAWLQSPEVVSHFTAWFMKATGTPTDGTEVLYRRTAERALTALAESAPSALSAPEQDLTSRRTDGRCILHFGLDPATQWTDGQTLEHFLRCTKPEDQLDQWRMTTVRAGQGWRCVERDHETQLEKYRQIARERTERAIVQSETPEPRPRDGILLEYLLTEALKVVKG